MKDRLLEINPDLDIVVYDRVLFRRKYIRALSPSYDYVVDAIDMVSAKIKVG